MPTDVPLPACPIAPLANPRWNAPLSSESATGAQIRPKSPPPPLRSCPEMVNQRPRIPFWAPLCPRTPLPRRCATTLIHVDRVPSPLLWMEPFRNGAASCAPSADRDPEQISRPPASGPSTRSASRSASPEASGPSPSPHRAAGGRKYEPRGFPSGSYSPLGLRPISPTSFHSESNLPV